MLGDSGISFAELEANGYCQLTDQPVDSARPFATPTGKIELYATTLEDLGLDPLPAHTDPARDSASPGRRARYPLTFYGLLSKRALGEPLDIDWSRPPLSASAFRELINDM